MGKSGAAPKRPGNVKPSTRSGPVVARSAIGGGYHSPALTRALDAIEPTIIYHKVEHAHVLAADGSPVFTKTGRKSSIQFTGDELARMRGQTLTHNHNVEVSFSPNDIRIAIQQQLAEMRAVSPGYRYSVRAPEKGWPKKWEGAAKMLYSMYLRHELSRARSAMLAGRMTMDEANATVLHNVWTNMHAAGLIHYERTPWKS